MTTSTPTAPLVQHELRTEYGLFLDGAADPDFSSFDLDEVRQHEQMNREYLGLEVQEIKGRRLWVLASTWDALEDPSEGQSNVVDLNSRRN